MPCDRIRRDLITQFIIVYHRAFSRMIKCNFREYVLEVGENIQWSLLKVFKVFGLNIFIVQYKRIRHGKVFTTGLSIQLVPEAVAIAPSWFSESCIMVPAVLLVSGQNGPWIKTAPTKTASTITAPFQNDPTPKRPLP